VSDTAFISQAAYQQFYSLYRLGVTIASFLVQSFLTSRLIERMNLKNTFFIFPAVVMVGVIGMVAMPGLGTAVLAMSLVKLVRETIDESARKAFQSLVPEERRGRVSTFMDSYLPALGTILACLLTGAVVLAGLWLSPDVAIYVYVGVALLGAVLVIWVVLERWPVLVSILTALLAGTVALLGVQVRPDQAFYFYLALVALSASLAIWSVVKMRAVYESSLLNWRLKRRQRGSRVLDKLEF
jgi:MFS family permease